MGENTLKFGLCFSIVTDRSHHLLLSRPKRYPKVIFHLSIDGYLIINLKVKQFLFLQQNPRQIKFLPELYH